MMGKVTMAKVKTKKLNMTGLFGCQRASWDSRGDLR